MHGELRVQPKVTAELLNAGHCERPGLLTNLWYDQGNTPETIKQHILITAVLFTIMCVLRTRSCQSTLTCQDVLVHDRLMPWALCAV